MTFFRYRPYYIKSKSNPHVTNHLIDELTNNYMFFASSSSENDINEGHPIFYLKGGIKLWKGIFKYYYYYVYSHIMGSPLDDLIRNEPKRFLNDRIIQSLIKQLSLSQGIYPHEIRLIFMEIYNLCESYVYIDHTLSKYGPSDKAKIDMLLGRSKFYINLKYYNDKFTKPLYEIVKYHSRYKLYLRNFIDKAYSDISNNGINTNHYVKLLKFTSEFIGCLFRLSIPSSYIVSLTTRSDNDAMWANYANEYSGVCIEYKYSNIYKKTFDMYDSDKFNNIKHYTLYNVNYKNKFPKYNLFSYLDINNSILRYVFSDIFKSNKLIQHDIYDDKSKKAYLAHYKKMCYTSITTKSKDWHDENEVRLIRMNNNIKNNKQYYKFTQVKSITLGSRLPLNIELKIIGLVKIQCEKNNVYNFIIYKMRKEINGKIKRVPLIIINNKK